MFATEKALREYLILGAGFVDIVPGPDGTPNAVAQSISFETLSEAALSELHRAVDDFLWTPGCQEMLWPQLPPNARYQMISAFMRYMSARKPGSSL